MKYLNLLIEEVADEIEDFLSALYTILTVSLDEKERRIHHDMPKM